MVKLAQPIPVYNVDGTLNEAGSITEVVSLILHYNNHSERMTFCVTNLGTQKLILRHSWLRKHNPEIDWSTGKVKMSRCPPRSCSSCQDELRQERITRKAESKKIDTCSLGPLPEVDHDSEDDSGPSITDPEDEPISIEDGDWIFSTGLLPTPSMEIRASL